MVPAIFQIFKGETTILGICLLPLRHKLNPESLPPWAMAGCICTSSESTDPLRGSYQHGSVQLFRRTNVSKEDGISKKEGGRTSDISLLEPSQITLRDENVTHRKHSETTKFFRCVEDDRWETRQHLTVQTDLDTRLNFVPSPSQGSPRVHLCG